MTDYDYAGRMRVNRNQWAAIGVSNTSLLAPERDAEWFRNKALIATGIRLSRRVEEREKVALEAFSNKQPRLGFKYEDALVAQYDNSDAALKPQLAHVIDLMRLMQEERTEANRAESDQDWDHYQYLLAREYAMVYYLRGYWGCLRMLLSGYIPPADMWNFERKPENLFNVV